MASVAGSDTGMDDKRIHRRSERRQREWAKEIDFMFVTIGSSVGFGNVWRFPYVCYRNGGGVFLIPYFVATLLIGIPVSFLESGLGQFMSRGVIASWKISPLCQGLGCSLTIFLFYSVCNYNVIMAWVLYYLFASFTSVLPWSHCGNEWNTENCHVSYRNTSENNNNSVLGTSNNTPSSLLQYEIFSANTSNVSHKAMGAATEFWERKVLSISDGIENIGSVKWDLALCLLLAWILVYLCIWKGVKLTGKIAYITATLPYVLLFILLIRGVTLEGASDGIRFFLSPDWSKLWKTQVWVEAGIQVFFSNSLAVSLHTALGSCNKFHHNSLRDLLIFTVVNSLTSLLSGFVIFSVLGFMAHQQNVSVGQVAGSGPGLAFVVYPEAISQMPIAPFWSSLFFFMLVLLGIDTQFGLCESLVINLTDIVPRRLIAYPYKEVSIAILCVLCFLCGLPMVTKAGVYIEQLVEWYCQGRIRIIIAFGECGIIAWIYGVSRFQKNMEYMLGYRLGPFFKVTWTVVTPAVCLVMFIVCIIFFPEMTYNRKSGVYYFPWSARAAGWVMSAIPVLCFPGVMIWKICETEGSLIDRIRHLIQPDFNRVQHQRDRQLETGDADSAEGLAMKAQET